jgi:hypothetical protein
MADKYPTMSLIGVTMQQTNSGQFVPKEPNLTPADFHTWRIGKHTKGKPGKPGQLFLTENNLTIMLVDTEPLDFKKRHDVTPMGRFLTTSASDDVLKAVLKTYQA